MVATASQHFFSDFTQSPTTSFNRLEEEDIVSKAGFTSSYIKYTSKKKYWYTSRSRIYVNFLEEF